MKKLLFEFKGDRYTLLELFNLHKMGKNLYKEGSVVDLVTGESFEIENIYNQKQKYYQEFQDLTDKLNEKSTTRIKWAVTQNEIDIETKELNNKYEKNTITLEEMELLLKLEKGIKLYQNYYVTFPNNGTFYKKYHGFKYPEELSTLNIGRLHLLLDFMTYNNEIKRTNRDNSKYPTTQELMDFMRLNDKSTLSRTLRDLKKYRIIDYSKTGKNKIIYINPMFSDRNLKIHPEIYLKFREDLDKVLEPKEVKYLQMLTNGDYNFGVLTLDDS